MTATTIAEERQLIWIWQSQDLLLESTDLQIKSQRNLSLCIQTESLTCKFILCDCCSKTEERKRKQFDSFNKLGVSKSHQASLSPSRSDSRPSVEA